MSRRYIYIDSCCDRNLILIIRTLKSLILEIFDNVDDSNVESSFRFLLCALRLSDHLCSTYLKSCLKHIILEENSSIWGNERLDKLHQLCASSLSELCRNKNDFSFWEKISNRQDICLPYALNTAIEIDIKEGFKLFWCLYIERDMPINDSLINWGSIINDTYETYKTHDTIKQFEESLYSVIGQRYKETYITLMIDHLQLSNKWL